LSERNYRRAKFNLTCTLQTSYQQIDILLPIIEQIILDEPLCKKKAPKIIFEGFGPYSLDISITFWVNTADFAKFQLVKQAINLNILKALEEHQIKLASSVA
ncbi:MAG: hypothetical protein RJA76_2023, partial [Bacteroidota bacterium]